MNLDKGGNSENLHQMQESQTQRSYYSSADTDFFTKHQYAIRCYCSEMEEVDQKKGKLMV